MIVLLITIGAVAAAGLVASVRNIGNDSYRRQPNRHA